MTESAGHGGESRRPATPTRHIGCGGGFFDN
jgi:hypothetical protein